MWFQKWKIPLRVALVILALALLKTGQHHSVRWYIGAGIVALVVIAVVIETAMTSGSRGRPCPACGEKIQMKAFTLIVRCPHCGRVIE